METINSSKDYKVWLRTKLRQLGISSGYLVAMAIVTERAVQREQSLLRGYLTPKPFYLVFEDKEPTRVWYYLAEGAIFLKHRGYSPYDWVQAVCHHEKVQRMLSRVGHQLPVSVLFPTTRLTNKYLIELDDFYKEYSFRRNGNRNGKVK